MGCHVLIEGDVPNREGGYQLGVMYQLKVISSGCLVPNGAAGDTTSWGPHSNKWAIIWGKTN